MPRPKRTLSQRPSLLTASQLASYLASIRRQYIYYEQDLEHFLKKARRSVIAFLNERGVHEHAQKIYENLEYLITFRIGTVEYIEDIVHGVLDTIYDNEYSMLPHAS